MIYLSDSSAYHAEQAVAKRERAFAARQHEDWGFWDGAASMGPPIEVREPIDWWGVAGTVGAVLFIAAFWVVIIFRFARGVWPWQ